MVELTDAILVSVFTGVATAAATVAALKTDIGWLKHAVERAHSRIDALESRCNDRHAHRCD